MANYEIICDTLVITLLVQNIKDYHIEAWIQKPDDSYEQVIIHNSANERNVTQKKKRNDILDFNLDA